MKTSLKAGFAQIFSCCPKILSCPKFGGAAAPLAPRPVRLWWPLATKFRTRLFFGYQVELHSRTAFKMLRIAEDLEITDLQLACEQYFMDNLSVDNAAEFLADALSLAKGAGAGGMSSLVNKCIGFMEENAEEVIHTEGFLQLPKAAMIRLVSSDQVSINSELEKNLNSRLCFGQAALSFCLPGATSCLS